MKNAQENRFDGKITPSTQNELMKVDLKRIVLSKLKRLLLFLKSRLTECSFGHIDF